MKRVVMALLVFGLLAGCQKTEQQEPAANKTPQQQTQKQPEPKGPPLTPSDALVKVDDVTGSPGDKGSFQIHYFGVEPAKALVVPLKVTDGMYVDSVSWKGSMVDYLANKPVRIDSSINLVLMAAVPVTEALIPPDTGLIATVYFTFGPNAKSGQIEETFATPANHLSYVDTSGTHLMQPYYQGGKVTIQ
jgi:hypothetical protein